LSYNEALDICIKYANEMEAYGFFYQKHTNGHQIVGLYRTEADMKKGRKVLHGHDKGLIATRIPKGRYNAPKNNDPSKLTESFLSDPELQKHIQEINTLMNDPEFSAFYKEYK